MADLLLLGGSGGIGEFMARYAASQGQSVYLGARSTGKLKNIVEDIRSEGGIADSKGVDATNEKSIHAFVDTSIRETGLPKLAIYNAGMIGTMNPTFVEKNPETFRKILQTNAIGALLFAQALMRRQANPIVLFIGSHAAYHTFPNQYAYGMSKAAIVKLADDLNANNDLDTFVIHPTHVDTKGARNAFPDLKDVWDRAPQPQEFVKEYLGLALTQPRQYIAKYGRITEANTSEKKIVTIKK